MKLPPFLLNVPEGMDRPCVSVRFEYSGQSTGTGSVEVCDEGGGAFIEIKADADDPLRLDRNDVQALANWAKAACDELDRVNPERAKC